MNNTEQTIIREPDWNQIENFLILIHSKLGGLIDVRAFPKPRQLFSKDIDEIKKFITVNIDQNICCGIASRRGKVPRERERGRCLLETLHSVGEKPYCSGRAKEF